MNPNSEVDFLSHDLSMVLLSNPIVFDCLEFGFFDLVELCLFVLDFVSCFSTFLEVVEFFLLAGLGIFTNLSGQSDLMLFECPGSFFS